MSASAEHLESALAGFTAIISMTFTYAEEHGYDLKLMLRNDRQQDVLLLCRDISHFNVEDFGGQLTRLFQLRVNDITARQLERIKLEFWDRAVDRMNFSCASAEVKPLK